MRELREDGGSCLPDQRPQDGGRQKQSHDASHPHSRDHAGVGVKGPVQRLIHPRVEVHPQTRGTAASGEAVELENEGACGGGAVLEFAVFRFRWRGISWPMGLARWWEARDDRGT